ncbi:MAG TPA: PepSY-associated TM helix domain-containing protein [Steroidobacteraceae bacterium]|nr:PepSY-associated TM helix domain-containing protein [Steroidobacteraceae bacterium]
MSAVAAQKRRAFWLKHLHQWHWISAGICLIAMLMFSITGITLNHAAQIAAKPIVTSRQAKLPEHLLSRLSRSQVTGKAPLPSLIEDWVKADLAVEPAGREAEWSADEVYLSLPRPGGDAWLSIERESGTVQYERTERGWVSYFNDLHKGRNTGPMWGWFIDVFAAACVLFAGTGLFLLKMHSSRRPGTWPIVAAGLALPVVLLILFVH